MNKYLEKKRLPAFLFLLVIFVCTLSIGFLSGILVTEPDGAENRGQLLTFLAAATIVLVLSIIILWNQRKTGFSERIPIDHQKGDALPAEDLENEKKYFSSILSHDLRSPLSSIVLLSSYIRTKEGNPETLRYIELIEQSARKELEMMATLLALMRADSFKADHVEDLNLDALIQETLEHAEAQLAKKSIQAITSITPDLSFSADPDNLKLILKSLISQAICYSDTGQAIDIKAFQNSRKLTIELTVLSGELHGSDDTELFRSDRLTQPNTGNAFPDCIHFYFLGRAIRNYKGTIHVQREVNNPASRIILALETLPNKPTA